MSVYLIVQGKLKTGAQDIYDDYLRGVAPLMKEFGAEIVAVGAGERNEYATESFPINAVMRFENQATLKNFLGNKRYLEIRRKYRDAAYDELHLSIFTGRAPRNFSDKPNLKINRDAYGQQLLAQYNNREPTAEIIERDDGYIDTGSNPGLYFSEYRQWSSLEKRAVKLAKGRVLDVGCGAGRHALYLQEKGFDVVGIDNSPGAIRVCKLRGLKRAIVRPINNAHKFKPASFDTIIMMGNNFGLFGSKENAREILKKFARIAAPDARIIAKTLNPYITDNPLHPPYTRANRRRGRMGGQIRMRVRYGKTVGEWFDYLFVSPEEMREILRDTDWQIEELFDAEEANYVAVIQKKSS